MQGREGTGMREVEEQRDTLLVMPIKGPSNLLMHSIFFVYSFIDCSPFLRGEMEFDGRSF